MGKIGIIDYGVGNLRSIQKGFEYYNIDTIISSDLEVLKQCEKLILPGVGAYAECKKMLDDTFGTNLLELLKVKPVLGICVGMQLLFNYSLEFGKTEGLNLIDGFIDKIDIETLPVPHVGWNKINILKDNVLFSGISSDTFFYFTHSFKCNAKNSSDILAEVEYDILFTCAVNKNNMYGVQFHPEKSGEKGLLILKNFAELC